MALEQVDSDIGLGAKTLTVGILGNRVNYDRTTLLALAGSQFAKAPPVKMAFIPGVTRTPNQSDVVMAFRKIKDRKKEKEKEKKTFNPFALLGDGDE